MGFVRDTDSALEIVARKSVTENRHFTLVVTTLGFLTLVAAGGLVFKYDYVGRVRALLNGMNYSEYKTIYEERNRREHRMPVDEFFLRYDLDRDGSISQEEYRFSLPFDMKKLED